MYVDTQVRPQGEQVDAVAPAKLTLSAAIRIGAKIRPQCSHFMFANGASCALGALYEGTFGHPGVDVVGMSTVIADERPILCSLEDAYPELPRVFQSIYRKNDGGESRESIADWLEAQGL